MAPRAPRATGNAARMRRLRPPNAPGSTITPIQQMEMWLGPSHHGSACSDDEQRHRLWCEHRERLMKWFAHDGRRPQAWWKFEALGRSGSPSAAWFYVL
jgi:hypothetical protein